MEYGYMGSFVSFSTLYDRSHLRKVLCFLDANEPDCIIRSLHPRVRKLV